MVLSGCQKTEAESQEPFVGSIHPRTENYTAEFDTMSKSSGNLTVQIVTDIYEETLGESLFNQIQSDYQILAEKAELTEQELTVYVVEQTIAGKPQVIENEVFCSREDIESGAYRTYLVKACLKLRSMWQCVGLGDVLFLAGEEEKQIDMEALQQYYSNSENSNTLSLFPAYFIEDFTDAETKKIAEDTAVLLTQHVLETYGREEYLSNGNDVHYRNEWLEAIGVNEKIPWANEDMEYLNYMDFTITVYEPLIVTAGVCTFYLEPTYWLVTAEDAFLFVKDTMEGYERLMEVFESYGVDQMDVTAELLKMEKSIHLKESSTGTSYASQSQIYLQGPGDVWHELIHTLIPPSSQSEKKWMGEGIADFFSRPIQFQSSFNDREWKGKAFDYLTNDLKEEWITADMHIFQNLVINYYQKNAELPMKEDEVNSLLFYEALAKVRVLNPEVESGWPVIDAPITARGYKGAAEYSPEKDGNALSYAESYLFIKYLVEKYGMESVVTVTTSAQSFETVFGNSYENEYQEWQTILLQEDDYIWEKTD